LFSLILLSTKIWHEVKNLSEKTEDRTSGCFRIRADIRFCSLILIRGLLQRLPSKLKGTSKKVAIFPVFHLQKYYASGCVDKGQGTAYFSLFF
jgi:hypothetical protein